MSNQQAVNMNETFDNNWLNNKSKEDVIKQIGELHKNIKQKHQSLKREMIETEELWERQLKPISEPYTIEPNKYDICFRLKY